MKHFVLSFAPVLFLSLFAANSFEQVKKTTPFFPDDPSAHEEYNYIRLRDPNTNEIPPFIEQKEFEFASKLPKHDPFGGRLSPQGASDWVPSGPANQSGRVQAIGIDILNENNILAGTASGGVWRSIDGGQSWVRVTLANAEESVSAIVQDTRKGKESTWYYSTSELLSTTDRRETSNVRTHSWGNGIYKSTDNGASWDPLPSTLNGCISCKPINFAGIWNLVLDTKNLEQDIIYAATYGAIVRSSDGGGTWAIVLDGGNITRCFNSEIIMGSGGTLYAALGSAYDGTIPPHQGVWRSTDGVKWTNISSPSLPGRIRRTRLALSESNENILYVLTETPNEWNAPDTELNTQNSLLRYTYLSGDGTGSGGSWELRTAPFLLDPDSHYQSLGGYALVLAVHPDDPDQVLVGGTNLYYSTVGFEGSSSFIKIGGYPFTGDTGTLHPDMHACVFSKKDHAKIFVATDGGIYEVDDVTSVFDNWNYLGNGLSSSQVYHSSLDRDTAGSDFILSGLQDNNTLATQSSSANDPWFVAGWGDGMTTSIASLTGKFFSSSQWGNIFCFSNDGQGMTYLGTLPTPSASSISTFFTNYIVEPNHQEQLYEAWTDHLWRYNTLSALVPGYLAPNWNEIPAVYNELHPRNAFISTFGFATNVNDRLFLGTNIGKVYRVDNVSSQSPTLTDISGTRYQFQGFVAGIDVDPLNADEILVAFSNYGINSIFRTTDGGKSWAAISGNLEQLPDGTGSGPSVRCVKILHTPSG
ncbi:MAG: WD40/YVTN/BNR-like repeat-containing protein, partial [Candidatus Kapaibacterium sp.]